MKRKYSLAFDDMNLDDLMPGLAGFPFAGDEVEAAEIEEDDPTGFDEGPRVKSRVRITTAEDPVQFYLRAIGRIKLLAAAEEIELARRKPSRRDLPALARSGSYQLRLAF